MTVGCATFRRIGVAAVIFAAAAAVSHADDAKTVALFDGKSLTGWSWQTKDPTVKVDEVFRVDGDVLVCKGKPIGCLRTEAEYESYLLTLKWRWKPGGRPGNGGVLVHATTPGEMYVWPKSIEVQLGHRNAGDLWVIGTYLEIDNGQYRRKGRRYMNLTDDSEKPRGQWNSLKVTCKGDELIVHVNDKLVNHAKRCSVQRGAICLQSEGTEIHFRDIRLKPLSK